MDPERFDPEFIPDWADAVEEAYEAFDLQLAPQPGFVCGEDEVDGVCAELRRALDWNKYGLIERIAELAKKGGVMTPERFDVMAKAFFNAHPRAYIVTATEIRRKEWEADIKKVEALIEADLLKPRKVEAILLEFDRLPLGDYIVYDEGTKELVLAHIEARSNALLMTKKKYHEEIRAIDREVDYIKRMESKL
jgi:hypothetical protein